MSGGEPFHQAAGLFYLLKIAKEVYGLTTVVYTGFEYDKLTAIPQCRPGLGYIDVLIDGRFEKSKKSLPFLQEGQQIRDSIFSLTATRKVIFICLQRQRL